MTIVGFTGHQNITAGTRLKIAEAIMAELARLDPGLVGVSSLAAGADQVFAFCVLAAGGRLNLVLPAAGYRDTMSGTDQVHYDHLLPLADRPEKLHFDEPSEAAYLAAGRRVVDLCDLLLAVWDGKPAGAPGGTADIVADALAKGKAVRVIWPAGSGRTAAAEPSS